MIKKDVFDMLMVKNAVEKSPESQVFDISGNLKAASFYEERILERVKLNKHIRKISNHPSSMDGLNFIDSIVLLCGYWWQNKNAIDFIENFSQFAKLIIPVTHIPPLRGGEGNGEKQAE